MYWLICENFVWIWHLCHCIIFNWLKINSNSIDLINQITFWTYFLNLRFFRAFFMIYHWYKNWLIAIVVCDLNWINNVFVHFFIFSLYVKIRRIMFDTFDVCHINVVFLKHVNKFWRIWFVSNTIVIFFICLTKTCTFY